MSECGPVAFTQNGSIAEPVAIPDISEQEVRDIAWTYCGISRSGEGLDQALQLLARANPEVRRNSGRAQFELRNIYTVANLIARAALAREESRGAHYRTDFTQALEEFRRHSRVQKNNDQVTFA